MAVVFKKKLGREELCTGSHNCFFFPVSLPHSLCKEQALCFGGKFVFWRVIVTF